MKQTKLPFGSPKANRVAKLSSPTRVCVHHNLYTIRFCKRCYTINALRQRCTNTISHKTGCPLGTYGTKKQLLERLIKNEQLFKSNNASGESNLVFGMYTLHLSICLHICLLRLLLMLTSALCTCSRNKRWSSKRLQKQQYAW